MSRLSQNTQPASIFNATINDLDTITEIESESFSNPWPRQAIQSELSNLPWSCSKIITYNNIIAGYMIYWIIENEYHLQKIAVKPYLRRKGLAGKMISHLKAEASKNNIQMILLELRQTNKAALKLYSGLGFKQQGIRKKYYSDTGEDALLMTLSTKAD